MNEVKRLEWSFQELVENSGDIFIGLDSQYKIRYISSSIAKVYDIEPVNLVGRDIFDFVESTMVDTYREVISKVTDNKSYEVALEFQKGTKYYFDAFIKHDENNRGFALKLHDVTEKKAKEKELIKTNKQLDQVIYKTTHDLKAPVLSAIGLINLAEKAPLEQKEEYLVLIRRSLMKLSGLIEEMNDFFRNDKLVLKREKIEVGRLVNDEVESLKSLYQAGKIKISTTIDESAEFFSDAIRLKTIITNFLTNAIKYADATKAHPFIKVSAKVTSESCELIFEDNGIGIEEEYKAKIFDLFYRATTQSQGTGIGLFIVKDTVDRLQGRIEVQSEIGVGTTFKVQIPNQLFKTAELN